jgi:uncharacterized zinc-type alcohol dehydrogenase-like protein
LGLAERREASCRYSIAGNQNLCFESVAAIIGHYGGFADRVRAQWPWVVPLPEGLDHANAGPLLCGGTTVFAPLKVFDVKPTDHVGVVGIDGLGYLGVKFARAWGCEVTAFTSNESKADEARSFGAHHVVGTRNDADLKRIAGSLDLLLVTVNAALNWPCDDRDFGHAVRLSVDNR